MQENDRPTLKTIAFMAGLGVTTVSRALKDAPEIGIETRKRVQLIARQVGYRPNRAGVRLRTGKTNVIALVLNTQDEIMGFTSHVIHGVSEALANTQYHLIVTPYSHSKDPLDPVRYIVETSSADGIIFSRTEPDDARVRYLTEHHVPFATHGRTDMGITHPFHDFDNYSFARHMVARLVERKRQRLAILTPPAHLAYYGHMVNGFFDGVRTSGSTGTILPGIDIDTPLETLRLRVEAIMRRSDRPDGIVCGSSASTIATVAGIEAAGLRLGTDVDVASKQSTDILPWFRPELIVVEERFQLAGRKLAQAVLARIAGADPGTLQSIG
ncbi:LacI family DNA-binding transcriptional regulator [Phyllobacterium salinisoli]|uniref:LacI family DNA-binding transcriptional regulator n=1 Tax=Phyllobacterium salinisoli TaxID=1899321 RepID=A0A368JYS6_9HYPH|nr:LacI family transcriptional regulator [Phyllobacterium salinisoli]RCS22287.1 LacI family DNA-binding transcriptional regulator [Phyllobacterium salinisoli]